MTSLERLVRRINQNGDINDPETPRPLVTLEEFFEGNEDYSSIGYNFYPDQPSPAEFYEFFKQIRNRSEVKDVRIQISQQEIPEEWPSTETIWVITRATVDDLESWLGERFRADEIFVGWPEGWNLESCSIPKGMQALGIWWD